MLNKILDNIHDPRTILLRDYEYPIKGENKPKPHQKATVEFYLRNKRAYNLSTMGTGKTLSSLWACDYLFMNDRIKSVLIACPLSTIDLVWADEIKNHFPHRVFKVLHGTKNERIQLLNTPAHFYIINHDGIKVILEHILKKKPDILIIDESTCCKNFQTDRTKQMKMIADRCKAVWALTGEPTPNSPLEAFGQAKVVNPARAPKYFSHFRDATMIQMDTYNYIPRPGWEQKVAAVLSPSIRFTLEEVAKDMPPITFESREFQMTKEQERAYKQMYKEFVLEYENGLITAVNSGVKTNKLLQISSGTVIDTQTGDVVVLDNRNKLNGIYEIQQEAKKLIIFVPFRASLAAIQEFLVKKKISVGVVHGDVDRKKRGILFHKFQKEDLQVLLMHPKTSAHGLTLTKSHTITWFSPYADNEIYNQANGRIRRFGQEHPQVVFKFSCSPIERRVYSILEQKGRMSKNLLQLFSNPIF